MIHHSDFVYSLDLSVNGQKVYQNLTSVKWLSFFAMLAKFEWGETPTEDDHLRLYELTPELANEVCDLFNMVRRRDDIIAALTRQNEALRSAQTGSTGGEAALVLVPREPTETMISAGLYHNHQHNPARNMVASYRAMVEDHEYQQSMKSAEKRKQK